MRINEGKAEIRVAKGVFYNPEMSALRELSILFVKSSANAKSSLLDSTTATGVRAIRYAKEAGIRKILLLDINESAARNARRNLRKNKLGFRVINRSLREYASGFHDRFDIIDLDPFGTPANMIEDAVLLSKDGGLLMITATDTAVLCGAHEHACLKTYHSKPLHTILCKEAGIRILLSYISRVAARFNYGIDVKLSVSNMHYMRVFIQLREGAKNAVDSLKKNGFCAYCGKCNGFSFSYGIAPMISKECVYCNAPAQIAGPLWLGNLHDSETLKKMQKQSGRLTEEAKSQLDLISKELDTPMFYSIPRITRALKIGSVSHRTVMRELRAKGFHASATQFERDSLKTNADLKTVTNIVKRAAVSSQ